MNETSGVCDADQNSEKWSLKVEKSYFSKKDKSFNIIFSEPVTIDWEQITLLKHSIENLENISEDLKPKELSLLEDKKQLQFYFEFQKNYEISTYKLTYIKKEGTSDTSIEPLITSRSDPERKFINFPISIKFSFFTSATLGITSIASKSASYATIGFMAILLVFSMNAALILIKFF